MRRGLVDRERHRRVSRAQVRTRRREPAGGSRRHRDRPTGTSPPTIFCGFRSEYSGRWVAHGRVDERAACRSLQVSGRMAVRPLLGTPFPERLASCCRGAAWSPRPKETADLRERRDGPSAGQKPQIAVHGREVVLRRCGAQTRRNTVHAKRTKLPIELPALVLAGCDFDRNVQRPGRSAVICASSACDASCDGTVTVSFCECLRVVRPPSRGRALTPTAAPGRPPSQAPPRDGAAVPPRTPPRAGTGSGCAT